MLCKSEFHRLSSEIADYLVRLEIKTVMVVIEKEKNFYYHYYFNNNVQSCRNGEVGIASKEIARDP